MKFALRASVRSTFNRVVRPAAASGAFALLLFTGAMGEMPTPAAAEPEPVLAPRSPIPAVFTNPLLRPPAQDPQVTHHEGKFYYCESDEGGVYLRVSQEFSGLSQAPRRRIWAPAATGPISRNIWAPELHILDGKAYIYVAADDGRNENHRMFVLEAETRDLLGRYRVANIFDTGGWAIDGTVLTLDDGSRYFIWSGWPGKVDGQQNLYISRMKSPTQLVGKRVLIKQPDQPWERKAMPICEGPQILRRDGRSFLIYSASGSWTADYCLGMLVLEPGADPMKASSWKLGGQVFARNQHAYGVGHCGFVESADGNEDWLVYHAKTLVKDGWGDREVRAQPFTWDVRGWPVFGEPVNPVLPLVHPGRTDGLLAAQDQSARKRDTVAPAAN